MTSKERKQKNGQCFRNKNSDNNIINDKHRELQDEEKSKKKCRNQQQMQSLAKKQEEGNYQEQQRKAKICGKQNKQKKR